MYLIVLVVVVSSARCQVPGPKRESPPDNWGLREARGLEQRESLMAVGSPNGSPLWGRNGGGEVR